MTERIDFPCPNCQHVLKIRTEYLGKRMVCKYCQQSFQAPAMGDVLRAAWTGELETAQMRVASLEAELQQIRNEQATRTTVESSSQAGLEQAQIEVERLRSDLAALQADRDEKTNTIARLETRIRELEEARASAEAAAEAARTEMARAQAEARAEAETQRQALQADFDKQFQEHRSRSDQLLAERESKIRELDKSHADAQASREEAGEALDKFKVQVERERQSREMEWQEVQRAHTEEADQRFRDEQSRAEERHKTILAERDELARSRDGWTQERIELLKQIDSLTRERDEAIGGRELAERQWKEDAARLSGSLDDSRHEASVAARTVEELTNRLESVQRELAELQHAHEQNKAEHETARQRVRELENLLRESHLARDNAHAQCEQHADRLRKVDTEIAELRSEREGVMLSFATLQKQLASEREQCEEKQIAARAKAGSEQQALQEEIDRLRQQALALRNALEGMGIYV